MTGERVNEWGDKQLVFVDDRLLLDRIRPLAVDGRAHSSSLPGAADGWQACISPHTILMLDLTGRATQPSLYQNLGY